MPSQTPSAPCVTMTLAFIPCGLLHTHIDIYSIKECGFSCRCCLYCTAHTQHRCVCVCLRVHFLKIIIMTRPWIYLRDRKKLRSATSFLYCNHPTRIPLKAFNGKRWPDALFCEHIKKGEVRSRKLRIVGFNTLKVILMTQTDVAL